MDLGATGANLAMTRRLICSLLTYFTIQLLKICLACLCQSCCCCFCMSHAGCLSFVKLYHFFPKLLSDPDLLSAMFWSNSSSLTLERLLIIQCYGYTSLYSEVQWWILYFSRSFLSLSGAALTQKTNIFTILNFPILMLIVLWIFFLLNYG